jgi:aspartyl-tRNA(Asn)/glutamyl-tRNA(Gln) amidotransferase subunit C
VAAIAEETVRRIAHLARIGVSSEEVAILQSDMEVILAFLDSLNAVDISQIAQSDLPSTSPISLQNTPLPPQAESIQDVLANAPAAEDDFFVIPKVVE